MKLRKSCLLGISLLFAMPTGALAGGVVTVADEAHLRAALAGGGTVTFAVDGTIVLANTLTITNGTTVDASGHSIIISGNNAVRVFTVTNPVTLSLVNLTIASGLAAGTNGANGSGGGSGQPGGAGQGGGVYVNGGTLLASGCQFVANGAVGGNGGNATGSPTGIGGNGGLGSGGAIDLNGGGLGATNCQFYGNVANGGVGGLTSGSSPGAGGNGCGGAIHSATGSVFLRGCRFETNRDFGGPAGISIGGAGTPGIGLGGAVCQNGGTVTATNCAFIGNAGRSADVNGATFNGDGGSALGGAVYTDAQLALTGGTFTSNSVLPGKAGGHNGAPGMARGGAVYGASVCQLSLINCVLGQNSASGGIGNNTGGGGSGEGGALYNGGTAILTQSSFLSNLVQGGYSGGSLPIGGPGNGGAIENAGSLTVIGCTFSGNMALGLDGRTSSGTSEPTSGSGGAIYNGGSCMITNSTITGNLASGGSSTSGVFNGANAFGGGIYQTNGVLISVNNTIAGNTAQPGTGVASGTGFGGGICVSNGTASLLNAIVANSISSSNGFGTLTDLGHNLSSDASCAFTGTGSLNNTDPKLGPLANYGGPTPTMALLSGSPAIDGGDNVSFPPTDQRGHARPFGSGPDIGAFESSPPYTIRGSISGRTLQSEVLVSNGSSTVATTNESYDFEGLATQTYSVTPQSPDYLFLPTSRSITVGPDQVGINFTAYRWNMLSLDDVTNSTMHVIFAGTNGLTYRLLNSSNLVQWSTVMTYTIGPTNYWEMFLPIGNSDSQFYRTVTP